MSLAAIVVLAALLRLHGIHDPILDHPGWRQGDTASIARNFATLRYNILYPQTNYDGPPPNYVELELQIVPFLAATLYKLFGIHEIFGRLLSVGFSLGTVAVIAFFGRWLLGAPAGLFAALLFAIMPGSFYYGRTFTPDTTMVFFLTAALYAAARLLAEDERLAPRPLARATALLTLAVLAKPVAAVALVPVAAMTFARKRAGRYVRASAIAVLAGIPLLIYALYDQRVSSYAEWHWASGITRLHVLPALRAALTTPAGFLLKWAYFRQVLGMLVHTMVGPVATALALLGFAFNLPAHSRCPSLFWGWLVGGLLYAYVVVAVERVDYYLYPLLPLAALAGGAALARVAEMLDAYDGAALRYAAAAAGILLLAATVLQNRAIAAPYYRYSARVYRDAVALDRTLAPGALVVMGHYDPSVLYYIHRYGWEEDPYLWTPFDEESAIRKGARYFIDIERNRFAANVELCAWMQRFPVLDPQAQWPVYVTDPAREKPDAQAQWQAFRRAEKAGHARAWLDARGLCTRPHTGR